MQPVKIVIPGEYWDSQIYAGRLYLFSRDGDIRTIDWDRLIEEWKIEDSLKLVMECAFKRSDYLYGDKWSLFFSDREIKDLIFNKFERLCQKSFEVSLKEIEKVIINIQDNPFPFPHTDSTIYKRKFYIASKEGIFESTCHKSSGYPISSRPKKKWDAPVLSLSASYNTLALAAGDNGLFELEINKGYFNKEPRRLLEQNCSDCNWTYYSIYASSHVGDGYLAHFIKEQKEEDMFERIFKQLISEQEIFNSKGYSWGTQDKLYQVINNSLKVVKYEPWMDNQEEYLRQIGTIKLSNSKGEIVSGKVSLFGTIIEFENEILVITSDKKQIPLKGEPVNWRIFPRSKFYENHLHVIYEDRMEVYSFNNDYFVNQEDKISGFVFIERQQYR